MAEEVVYCIAWCTGVTEALIAGGMRRLCRTAEACCVMQR